MADANFELILLHYMDTIYMENVYMERLRHIKSIEHNSETVNVTETIKIALCQ